MYNAWQNLLLKAGGCRLFSAVHCVATGTTKPWHVLFKPRLHKMKPMDRQDHAELQHFSLSTFLARKLLKARGTWSSVFGRILIPKIFLRCPVRNLSLHLVDVASKRQTVVSSDPEAKVVPLSFQHNRFTQPVRVGERRANQSASPCYQSTPSVDEGIAR